MTRWLSNVSLEDPLLITVAIVVSAVLLVALSLPFPGVRRTSAPRWIGVLAAGAAIGAVAGRKVSTLLGQFFASFVEWAVWSGWLIQAAAGRACGTGGWRTNRSGWAW